MNDATIIELVPGARTHGGLFVGRYFVGASAYGLVVSPRETDLEETQWGGTKRVAGALSYADGLANTEAMAAAGSKLAAQIRAMRLDGFDDWYLPSRLESLLLFGELSNEFEQDWYWTSTQYAGYDGYAWLQSFLTGDQDRNGKVNHCRARAVRRFTL